MIYNPVILKLYEDNILGFDFKGKHSIMSNIFNEVVLRLESKNDWLASIEDSIKGNSEMHDFGVPGFGAEVLKDKTIIYCDFSDEEIEITTNEFKQISEEYFAKLEEFNKYGKLLD